MNRLIRLSQFNPGPLKAMVQKRGGKRGKVGKSSAGAINQQSSPAFGDKQESVAD
jgi:hypothetical protein